MIKKLTYKTIILMLVVAMTPVFWGCKTTEPLTHAEADAQFEALVSLVESQSYTIDVQTVMPFNTLASQRVINALLLPNTGNTAGRINVRGQGHYLTVNEGNVMAGLPFFGEQRQGAGHYNSTNNGIVVDDTLSDYRVMPKKDKNRVLARFTVNDKQRNTESYDITITAFPNGNIDMVFSSSHRTIINYLGTIKPVEDTSSGKKL